jgi:hypothetical protein
VHDESSHGADSFRIFVEAYEQGLVGREGARKPQMQQNLQPISPQMMVQGGESYVAGRPEWW